MCEKIADNFCVSPTFNIVEITKTGATNGTTLLRNSNMNRPFFLPNLAVGSGSNLWMKQNDRILVGLHRILAWGPGTSGSD